MAAEVGRRCKKRRLRDVCIVARAHATLKHLQAHEQDNQSARAHLHKLTYTHTHTSARAKEQNLTTRARTHTCTHTCTRTRRADMGADVQVDADTDAGVGGQMHNRGRRRGFAIRCKLTVPQACSSSSFRHQLPSSQTEDADESFPHPFVQAVTDACNRGRRTVRNGFRGVYLQRTCARYVRVHDAHMQENKNARG